MAKESAPAMNPRIALFIDIENLIGCASTIGLPIEIAPILKKLKEFGKVHIRRSFGDIRVSMKSIGKEHLVTEVLRMLHQNLVQIEHIPYITQQKNTADIRLVVEALSLAFQYEDISHFAIVASDRDYVPLFNKLHELGRTVIAIGIDQANTNPMVPEAADICIYVENLSEESVSAGISGNGEGASKAMLESYFLLLRQAVRALENQNAKTVGTAVAAAMRNQRSDFSPELVGCSGFKEFVQKAEQAGVIHVAWPKGPGDFLITAKADGQLINRKVVLPQPAILRDARAAAHRYRNIIEERLRTRLPSHAHRLRIFQTLKECYDNLMPAGPFELSTWGEEAKDWLRHDGLEREVIDATFKMLLSLYFARCFHCEQGDNAHNPRILGLAHATETWEDRMNQNLIRNILLSSPEERLLPEGLSRLLYDDEAPEHVDRIKQALEEVSVR